MMNGNEGALDVYLGNSKIAQLELQKDNLSWQYTQSWQRTGYPVSPHLPLEVAIPSVNISRFLRNMFPEGAVLDELLSSFHLSKTNTFGLIRALGFDIPGAIVVMDTDKTFPNEAAFRHISDSELTQRLDAREMHSLIIWDDKPRLSVAGVQEKINVLINENNELGFGEGGLCSTHILKFEKAKTSNLVLNEFISLQLARSCGISVANHELRHYGSHNVLLVERFDRKIVSESEVKRRHMIDGCQALNLPPEYKYERNFGSSRDVKYIRDGASLPKLFDFTEQCKIPAIAKQQILDWVLFNILIFNYDAHGKNISFFSGHNGMTVAPFYDLLNIALYPQFEQLMAMAVGDEFEANQVHAYELAEFADNCGISRQLVISRLNHLIKHLSQSISEIIGTAEANNDEKRFLSQYKEHVLARCEHLDKQSRLIMEI